jgi:6-phosphogluconate dehydrogenase (decarboxylating)
MDVRDLEARRREVLVAPIPLDANQLRERWRGRVDRIDASGWVGDVRLPTVYRRVSDSGEGRWTLKAAIDEGVPAPVLSAALYQRFSSRGESGYADKVLSAMRAAFGGHREKP